MPEALLDETQGDESHPAMGSAEDRVGKKTGAHGFAMRPGQSTK